VLQVTINGQSREFPDGYSILQALHRIGIDIPAACFDERLEPFGGCRLCLVAVQGMARPVTACNTPIADGMSIETHAPEIEQERRTLLRLLAQNMPRHSVPAKEFYGCLREYGLESAMHGPAGAVDDSHPYIRVDMSQCIACFRCVRICADVQGQFTWQVWNRGDKTEIRPDSGTTFLESSCVSCGACAHTCPTGALVDKSILTHGIPQKWTKTTCPYCGVGCEMNVGTRDGRIVQIVPVMDAPVNKGHLCVKGRYAYDYVHAEDRATEPMIRTSTGWKVVSWKEAIAATAHGFTQALREYGPGAVGVLGSARATNEENYLAQKLARVVLGTNNVDSCARVCHAPSAAALKMVLGTGAATNSFDDIEQARTILVCGSNTTENHPIVGARIRQHVLRGANLIVIDPRQIELAEIATIHLPVRPGTNIPLFNAMANVIVEERLYDQDFIRARVAGWEDYRRFIQEWTPESVASICGVEADLIRRAARFYATAKPAMSVHGLGITEHSQGTLSVVSLINLALLTGNIGKPGAGVNPLRGQNNVQGAAHMGCEPNHLTGFVPIDAGRELVQTVWQAPVPKYKGLDLMQMMEAAEKGSFEALWVIGYDILLTNPQADRTLEAMRSMKFVVVQDMFMNETAREAHVFLPACSSMEKDGTFMNGERRVQRIRRAMPPIGNSKSDWEIICAVAKAMGHGRHFEFESAEQIWEEIRKVWKVGAGITYARLDHAGIQWPCPTEEHPGTRILHEGAFQTGARAALQRVEHVPSKEMTTDEFPLLLTTGRSLFQFNAGTMTLRTPNVVFQPTDYLDISPDDAGRLGIVGGEMVTLRSRHGAIRITVRLSPAVRPGEAFTTFTMPDVYTNRLTGPEVDEITHTPEYKVTAVRVEKE